LIREKNKGRGGRKKGEQRGNALKFSWETEPRIKEKQKSRRSPRRFLGDKRGGGKGESGV